MATVAQERPWVGRIFVDGEFKEPEGGRLSPVTDKATGEELAQAGMASEADVDRAVRSAQAAQPGLAALGYDERAGLLRRVARMLEERAEEVATLIVRETGGIPGKAQYEVGAAQNELYEAAALASRATAEVLPSHNTGKLSLVQRVPVGVVAAITPWNFPLVLGFRVLAPALALGNTVVLKPAPETPLTGGLLIAELFAEAGAPPGILHALSGDDETGKTLVAHPAVNMIHFTGSSAVGREIAVQGAGDFKRVSLELGGNNAFVVLDDADVDAASMVGAWSAFHYMGQTCITAGRHIVARNLFDDYVDRMAARAKGIALGDPNTAEVGLGPMISETQVERAHDLLERSLVMGARVVEGGSYDGLFYRPTVVVDVTPDMPIWSEEIFGPVAPVLAVDDDAEALRLVNDTPYGLVNAIYTGSPARGLAFAEGVRSGMVHVNDSTCLDEAHVPFGGMGHSGLGGRSGGEANLEEFTERRWIGVQREPVEYPY
jgi:benzaldehyde dehydrogenase (NAD)